MNPSSDSVLSIEEHACKIGLAAIKRGKNRSVGIGTRVYYVGRQWNLGYHEGMFWMREHEGRRRKIVFYYDQLQGVLWEIFGGRLNMTELKWIEKLAIGLLKSQERADGK